MNADPALMVKSVRLQTRHTGLVLALKSLQRLRFCRINVTVTIDLVPVEIAFMLSVVSYAPRGRWRLQRGRGATELRAAIVRLFHQ